TTLPRPEPKAGQVLVRVRGAAFNPADRKVATGKDGGKFLHASKFPLILGYDFCGVVEKSNAPQWEEGAAVYGFLPYSGKNRQGSFAEYLVAEADAIGARPTSIAPHEAASAATVGLTALQGLRDKGRLASGQQVLINGASGGVGSFAVQIAKREGATVTGTCSEKNIAFVESLGADTVIDYRKTAVRDVGQRFDIVFDAASTSSYGECAPIMNRGATYITLLPSLGFAMGWTRSLFSSRRVRFVVVKSVRDDLTQLARWIDAGDVDVNVDTTYPFAKVPEALAHLGGSVRGKLALEVG